MIFLLDSAWLLTKIFSYAGLATALAGVGVFGWHFVQINGAAGQSERHDVPAESWRGPGAKRGYQIMLCGAAMILFSIVLSNMLPNRL
jgi:hypothetical protein